MMLAALLLALSGAAGQSTDVFVSGQDGYHTFRIPSAIVTAKGAVLAFAEGRKGGQGDAGDIDLVLRRSADGGKTWGPLQVVWDDAGNTCGNPCPVVDRKTGAVLLLLTHNLGKDHESAIVAGKGVGSRSVWISRSDDDGLTWAKPAEITKQVKREECTWFATGPGVGIQMRSGRLVVPCDAKDVGGKHGTAFIIASEDGGATWTAGGIAGEAWNECQVVELADGALMLNMRNMNNPGTKNRRRGVSISRDGGRSWTPAVNDDALVEPVCQASLLRASWEPGVLLFSNPADEKARVRMTVRMSLDDGRTWPKARVLHEGPSAYSCLTMLPSGEAACLFEAGEKGAYERVVFSRFGLDTLR